MYTLTRFKLCVQNKEFWTLSEMWALYLTYNCNFTTNWKILANNWKYFYYALEKIMTIFLYIDIKQLIGG